MNIKDLKNSFENLKQRVLKTEGQKAAAEVGKIVSAINEAAAEKNNADKYKLAIQKVYNAISKAENAISNSENLADLQSLVNKLSSIKVGDANIDINNDSILIKKREKLIQNALNVLYDPFYKICVDLNTMLSRKIAKAGYHSGGHLADCKLTVEKSLGIINRFKTSIHNLQNSYNAQTLDKFKGDLEYIISNIKESIKELNVEYEYLSSTIYDNTVRSCIKKYTNILKKAEKIKDILYKYISYLNKSK